jgi:hypothetical protein
LGVYNKKRNEYGFIDPLEKNFWDMCVYELLKIKFDGDITNVANEIILTRRNFNQKK